jgi:hypothetical protein
MQPGRLALSPRPAIAPRSDHDYSKLTTFAELCEFGVVNPTDAEPLQPIVPLVHNRAVRLTTKRIEASTPLSLAEIRADKNHLRAEFAISTRRLEMTIEESNLFRSLVGCARSSALKSSVFSACRATTATIV